MGEGNTPQKRVRHLIEGTAFSSHNSTPKSCAGKTRFSSCDEPELYCKHGSYESRKRVEKPGCRPLINRNSPVIVAFKSPENRVFIEAVVPTYYGLSMEELLYGT
jgi:hypothetical protein